MNLVRWFFPKSFPLLVIVTLSSCISTQSFSNAQKALDEFHGRVRDGKFDKILSDAAPEFRNSIPGEKGPRFFSQIRDVLGAPVSSRPTTVRENHMPAGVFIQATYQTHFEKGDAQENFTWRVQGVTVQLVGYQVSSPQLLLR